MDNPGRLPPIVGHMLLIRSSETSITDTNQAFLMSVATYLLLIEVDQFPKGKKK
jgi:hypothetical protein